jgi:hypothetical protein
MKTMQGKLLRTVGFALGLAATGALGAAEVVAVLSADSAPYKAALAGLQAKLGAVDSAVLPALPDLKDAKVIVSFGGEAALKGYPARAALVAALLPDPKLKPKHGGPLTRVGIPPDPTVLAEKIRSVASGTLAVLDSGNYSDYIAAFKSAAAAVELTVQVEKVRDLADLALKLPGLKGKAKALWVPPDPLFMNPKTFGLLSGFCKAGDMALIAPLPALVKVGATAGIAPTFQQQGEAAGAAAKAYLAGGAPGDWVYSKDVEFIRQ